MIRTNVRAFCPRCFAPATGASLFVPGADPAPSVGDFAVCTTCAAVNVYVPDLRLRRSTPTDLERLSLGGMIDLAVAVHIVHLVQSKRGRKLPND